MSYELVACGYWDGYCKVIAMNSLSDIKKIKAKWIKDGAEEVRLLTIDEAKKEFGKWLEARI